MESVTEGKNRVVVVVGEALAEPEEAPQGGPPSWKAKLGIVFKSCDAAPGV